MGAMSQSIKDFMATYKVAKDEVWEVHGSAWVVKHKALERIAAEKGIVWDRPAMIEHDAANKIAVICVFGKLADRTEWSIGEASPANNKNAYCYAMAEKRGKDRVILKLLGGHGALYSESEADEFSEQSQPTKRQNPHVTRAADVLPQPEYDEHGEVIDNIPAPSPAADKPLLVKDQKLLYAALSKEMKDTKSYAELRKWGLDNKDRVGGLSKNWRDFLAGEYEEHKASFMATPDTRMAG